MNRDSVREQLEAKKSAILDKWSQLIVATYPSDTSEFLRRETDRFANPVGCTIEQEIKTIYDELLFDMNIEKLSTSLDDIIRIRSVQDFSPSQAIGFFFLLKQAARDELTSVIEENPASEELLKFESRIDELALLAFDIYTNCREKIYKIRVNEVTGQKEMALRMLARVNTLDEAVEEV